MNLIATFNIYQNSHVPLAIGNDAVEHRIVNTIETITNIPFKLFMVNSRKKEFVFARHLYAYLMYNYTTLSLDSIGRKVKPNRKVAHDNIIHSRSVIENIIDFQKDQRHENALKAIDMMNGYKRIKQSTAITNKLISRALKLREK
jgi:hypothetical protein